MSQRVARAARLAIISNCVLVVGKLAIGFGTGAVSILSEAAHSGVDLVVAFLVWVAVRYAHRPADQSHPFGHGKVEPLVGFGQALLIYAIAGGIIYEAIHSLIEGTIVANVGWGIVVMLLAALVNVGMARYLLAVAKAEGSPALRANGVELATDVITALGVVLGLSLVWLTGWHILDPLIGLVVSGVLLVTGTRVLLEAFHGLTDAALPDPELHAITQVLDEHADSFLEYHGLRARHVGSAHDVDVHVVVPKGTPIEQAHDLASHLEDEIADVLPQTEVTIHMEPESEAKGQRGHRTSP
jgi:cation diffusion facilitator family transporter